MWEKFKESKFAKKCKEIAGRRGTVVAALCLVVALAMVLSISIATNRAKKKYVGENGTAAESEVENNTEKAPEKVDEGTVQAPVHNESEAPVVAEPEEFELALPVGEGGFISKGHDSTIQVWSDTMGDYRVHLGIDIAAEKGAPVFAAADGVVAKIWDDALMGRCVAISHNDEVFTFYKNLDPILSDGIEVDAEVECGRQIGKVGESAIAELADEPHLHIEMTVNGLAVDPRDYFSDEALESLSKDIAFEQDVSDTAEDTESATEAESVGK